MAERPLLVAPVSGLPAIVFANLLNRYLPMLLPVLETRHGVLAAADIQDQWAGIVAAAHAQMAWKDAHISATGSGGRSVVPIVSLSADEIPASAAAELLGCSTRRIGQLCAKHVLAGRKVCNRWFIERDSVELHRTGGS